MMAESDPKVKLIPIEPLAELNKRIRQSLGELEKQFPIQVAAARAAAEFIIFITADDAERFRLNSLIDVEELISKAEYDKIYETFGDSKTDEERNAFETAVGSLSVLKELATGKLSEYEARRLYQEFAIK